MPSKQFLNTKTTKLVECHCGELSEIYLRTDINNKKCPQCGMIGHWKLLPEKKIDICGYSKECQNYEPKYCSTQRNKEPYPICLKPYSKDEISSS